LRRAVRDLSDWHNAGITGTTIVPYPHDNQDLHFAIWACLANARLSEERRRTGALRPDDQRASQRLVSVKAAEARLDSGRSAAD
jgi:hypothetical protein